MGKGTYLVVENSGNVILGHNRWFAHSKLGIWKTL